jgi:uncharacterized OB-fold protein
MKKAFAAWCRVSSSPSPRTRARPRAAVPLWCWLVSSDHREPVGHHSQRPIPLPVPSPLTVPFWAAVREHRLEIQRCRNCGGYEWTPQMVCSACLTDTLDWTAVSGAGTVFSCTIVRRPQSPAFEVPYVVAEVELDEGPRLLANIVGIEPEKVRIGLRVTVGFEDFDDLSLFYFRPPGREGAPGG